MFKSINQSLQVKTSGSEEMHQARVPENICQLHAGVIIAAAFFAQAEGGSGADFQKDQHQYNTFLMYS